MLYFKNYFIYLSYYVLNNPQINQNRKKKPQNTVKLIFWDCSYL